MIRGIPFGNEVPLPVLYKGVRLECSYRADFICFDEIIVEAQSIGCTDLHRDRASDKLPQSYRNPASTSDQLRQLSPRT